MTGKYIITKRVSAQTAKAALKKEAGDILSVIEEKDKQTKPDDYSSAIGFTMTDDDDD